MPLYYFQVQVNGVDEGPSSDPLSLDGSEHAWGEAVGMLGQILREMEGLYRPGVNLSVLVQNETRTTLQTLNVSGRMG